MMDYRSIKIWYMIICTYFFCMCFVIISYIGLHVTTFLFFSLSIMPIPFIIIMVKEFIFMRDVKKHEWLNVTISFVSTDGATIQEKLVKIASLTDEYSPENHVFKHVIKIKFMEEIEMLVPSNDERVLETTSINQLVFLSRSTARRLRKLATSNMIIVKGNHVDVPLMRINVQLVAVDKSRKTIDGYEIEQYKLNLLKLIKFRV